MYLGRRCELVTAPKVGTHANKVGHLTNTARFNDAP